MIYPKAVMKLSELKKMGFPEPWLMEVFLMHANRSKNIAWKMSRAENSPILFDTDALEKYRRSQCGV